ncbi:MAG TPA: chromosome segregation protein SMC [Cytophagales bacterium]|nr:chromosome segregation protein SMC [Cytophagales bacterium]
MLLTKLEIKGFKSFGDKVIINFDEGITGIVGPNGCGKSNVVDAIRWVLGEQKTKALRSEKMENVIFNGTKNRKPTQLAEVSLTFNNTKNLLPTEYSEVTITRKYYRSGESEYMLNGIACRLKDINNLFLDTGIGSDSYAIIELKMVDDILNDKDHSRRGLFEEAAGISKFKIRKKETFRKLEDTDKDLERVEDLLFEIGKNLKSLEKQAKQTEAYFKLKEEYKELSTRLARKLIWKYSNSLTEINAKVEVENDKKLTLSKQIAEKEALLEKEKAALINKEKLLASRQKSLNEHVNKIRQYESEHKIKNERLRYLNDKAGNLSGQLEQDKKSNERAEFSIESLTNELNSAEKIFMETEAKISVLKAQYEEQKTKTTSVQQQVNQLSAQLKAQQEENYKLTKSLEIKQIQLSSLKQELDKATTDSSSQSANLSDFEVKLDYLEGQLEDKRTEEANLKSLEEEIQKRISSTEHLLELIKEEKVVLTRKLDASQNEYNLTKSLVDNLEGFPEAIRFLKKNSAWGKNIPLLSDVISCEEKYKVTIENFLEPYMNYYIVDNIEQAYLAVSLLTEASRGKANFFLLDSFENYHGTTAKIIENATAASEIIEYDVKYRKLVQFVLDNVYLVQGGKDRIPKDPDTIFILEDGHITKRKHSITGGSIGIFEGKRIGRAKNLEKLLVQINSLSTKLEEVNLNLNEKIEELKNLKSNTYRSQLESLQTEIKLLSDEHITIKTRQEQFQQLLNSNTLRKEDILDKITDITAEIEETTPKVSEVAKALKDLEESITDLREDVDIQNDLLQQKSATFNQENILFYQQQNKVKGLEQEIGHKQNAWETSKARIDKNLEDLKETEDEIKRLLESAENKEDDLLELYTEKETIEEGVREIEKDYYSSRGNIDVIEKSIREVQRLKESSDTLINEFQLKLNELKLNLTSIRERLSVEFSLNADDLVHEDAEEQLDEETLKQKVTDSKRKLENIGPINPMAMEAYNEIKQRNDFIHEQREDLRKAKASLMETINQIDTIAKETFEKAFFSIRENFIKVFRSLFSEEDSCDLTLSDPNNPLDSTIDIIAKPKGKRPLTINQLSGGEKTLTATSLLFAIYLLKPAPFCIFDEVDAPLDDANIDKFNNIIKKFSSESQFIIVTHNKRTMASTDVIYGVTMIEQGVSRVVPVDLRAL